MHTKMVQLEMILLKYTTITPQYDLINVANPISS